MADDTKAKRLAARAALKAKRGEMPAVNLRDAARDIEKKHTKRELEKIASKKDE